MFIIGLFLATKPPFGYFRLKIKFYFLEDIRTNPLAIPPLELKSVRAGNPASYRPGYIKQEMNIFTYVLPNFVCSKCKKGIRERNDDWENMKGLGREAWYMYSFFSFFFALVYWPFVIRTLSTKSTNQTPGKG